MKNKQINNNLTNQKENNVVVPLTIGGHTGNLQHSTLHNIYHVNAGFSKIGKMWYLHSLTKFAMLTSYLGKGLYESQQSLKREPIGLYTCVYSITGNREAGTGRGYILPSYKGTIKKSDTCRTESKAEAYVWRGFVQTVADESGYWQQVLGNRFGFSGAYSYGPREQYRFYQTLQQFHDIFDEEGRIESQGEAGAYAQGYAGGAVCECGGSGAEVEAGFNSIGDVAGGVD